MFCVQCGYELVDGSRFCKKCGAPQPTANPESPSPQPSVPAGSPQPPYADAAPAAATVASGAVASLGTSKIVAIIAAVTVAVVAAIFALGGAGGSSLTSSSPAASASGGGSSAGLNPADSSADGQDASSGRIQASGFSFELPDYWQGKVSVVHEGRETTVYPLHEGRALEGYPLVSLKLVPANDPENGGDYAKQCVGRVYGDGERVDIWSQNWAAIFADQWYSSPGHESEQDIARSQLVVDLSTGGANTYEEAKQSGLNASSASEPAQPFIYATYDFLNETLVPTVVMDDGEDAVS